MSRSLIRNFALFAGVMKVVIYSSTSFASVSLKNGNFFVLYTDIVNPRIERAYNSKTAFKGIFGYGWGTEYEPYLTISADGSAVMHEYGGGAENRFSPVGFNQAELSKATDMIAGVAQKIGVVGTSAQLTAYKNKLINDAIFRNDEWEKFRAQGKLQARLIANGTQLHSNRFNYQYITKVAGGYIRSFDTGKLEKFDESGHLVRTSDKNGNFTELSYGKDRHLQKLIDNFNRKIFFTFGSDGLVSKIEGENGKRAEYKYNKLGELIYSRDVDGNSYTFKYDSQNRHNLIEVGYSDKTTMVMTYYGRDKYEHIKSVKDRDGTLTEYTYTMDPRDSGHYTAMAMIKDNTGKKVSQSKYEYFVKSKSGGEEWTYKMITDIDGQHTETTYNEQFGLPTLIKQDGAETQFEYDNKGHVTKKVTPTEITVLHYNSKISKVDKVTKYDKEANKETSWSTFEYDDKANLKKAINSEGKEVKLVYDLVGRISSLIDIEHAATSKGGSSNPRIISFKYNENSKPIEIKDPSLGTITVSYANNGEIKKVDSPAGRKIAMQVTSSFQNLLEIIRPAGVTLAF